MKKIIPNKRKILSNRKRRRINLIFLLLVISIVISETLYFSKYKLNILSCDKSNFDYISMDFNKNDVSNSEINNNLQTIEAINNINSFMDDAKFVCNYLYQQKQGVMPDGANGVKVAYLTFDDGPSETVTPLILDILKEKGVKATFFIIGKQINSSPTSIELLKRTFNEGHSIGNHTFSHNYSFLYPNQVANVSNILSDIETTNVVFRQVLGDDFKTRAVRLPGGNMSWHNIEDTDKALNENGYYSIDWNVVNGDAEGNAKNANELVEQVKLSIGNREKAIILMHDTYGKEETAKALPKIIDFLKEQGYEFHTIK